MALCIQASLKSTRPTASLSSSVIGASLTPSVVDAGFVVSCPIGYISSAFSLGGWDDELGWDDNLGWKD